MKLLRKLLSVVLEWPKPRVLLGLVLVGGDVYASQRLAGGMNLFDEVAKRAHGDMQFPTDLVNAYTLGKQLVEKQSERNQQ